VLVGQGLFGRAVFIVSDSDFVPVTMTVTVMRGPPPPLLSRVPMTSGAWAVGVWIWPFPSVLDKVHCNFVQIILSVKKGDGHSVYCLLGVAIHAVFFNLQSEHCRAGIIGRYAATMCRPLYGEQCGGKKYFLKRCLHQAETHKWKELCCDAHFRNTLFGF